MVLSGLGSKKHKAGGVGSVEQELRPSKVFVYFIGGKEIPWTARRSNQSILKEINPGISLEGLMLKLKLRYFGHLMRRVDSLEKTLMLGGIGGRRRRTTEDEMAGWHHGLDGHESE